MGNVTLNSEYTSLDVSVDSPIAFRLFIRSFSVRRVINF